MKKISEITLAAQDELQKPSNRSQRTTSDKTALPTSWISALFLKFQRRYLHKWSSAIDGDEAGVVGEWAKGLAGISGEQIKTGLKNWDEEWPPTMSEFRKCCLSKGKNDFGLDYVPEYYREAKIPLTRRLSSDERDAKRKANRSHIDKMKEALRR